MKSKLSSGKPTISSKRFKESEYDPNIQPNVRDLALGGLPHHWNYTAPFSKGDIRSVSRLVGERKVLTYDEFIKQTKNHTK